MLARLIFGFVICVIAVVISLAVFGLFSSRRSLPDYRGTEHVRYLDHPVKIYRDSFAIAHIVAETENDAYYALGYAHAEERMFQMDLTRRIGTGTLSEVFGDTTRMLDRWARTIGFKRIAVQMWNAASSKTRSFIASYTNGINDYINTHHGKFGFEFDGSHYEPSPWKPTDCMVIGRLMSWEMNFGFWNDAAFCDLKARLDSEHFSSIIPEYPVGAPTAIGGPYVASPHVRPIDTTTSHSEQATSERQVVSALHDLYTMLHGTIFGGSETGGGSNSIALSPKKSTSNASMLENDMHLALGEPARWYIAHLRSRDGLNVAGFTIPGLPVVLSGRNENLSWGITNGMIDESDYFVLPMDSTGSYYRMSNGWKPVKSLQELIFVRTGYTGYRVDTLDVRLTDIGPIISAMPTFGLAELLTSTTKQVSDNIFTDRSHKEALAVEWNGLFAMGDELGAFFALHRAKTNSEAIADMSSFATPCLNFSVVSNNEISYQLIGRIPIRNGNDERLLLTRNSSNAAEAWQGFYTGSELPHGSSPSEGYIISANDPPTSSHAISFGENWEPAGRAERLRQLISASNRFGVKDLSKISRDVSSPFEYHVLRDPILKLFGTNTDSVVAHDIVMMKAIDYLKNWDGVQQTMDVSTTILNVYLARLLTNTFYDELGESLFNEFCFTNNVPTRTIERLLGDANNIWWDDIRSPQRETRDEIITRSFIQTIDWLKKHCGNDIRRWNWGKFHTLTYEHPAGNSSSTVASLVNQDIGAVEGGLTTVEQMSYSWWNPFKVKVGPSMRMIADMSTHTLFVSLPTGNSGNPFSRHYRDMVSIFRRGEFSEIPMDRIDPTWQCLELTKE